MGFSFIFVREGKKKNPKFQQLFFLMLEAKHDNIKKTFASSSIKLSKVAKSKSSLNFRFMDLTKFSALLNNQWPLNWFILQVDIIRPRESIII
jgi:hypothetical protein